MSASLYMALPASVGDASEFRFPAIAAVAVKQKTVTQSKFFTYLIQFSYVLF
jgi:hypothetical protein